VNQARRRRAGSSAPVALVDKKAIDALKREITKNRRSIDAAADDQDLRARMFRKIG
jgi:hypothetical protein